MSRVLTPPLLHGLSSPSRPSILLRFLVAVALAWTIWTHIFTSRDQDGPVRQAATPPLDTVDLASTDPQLPCQSLKGLDDIFLIVRTGASEALRKLPVHFNTTLRCLPEESYGIWSDLEETIDSHYVGNALDEVSPGIINDHPDFDYYRRLQANGRSFSDDELNRWAHTPNTASGRDTPGWKLDKWKFLPLAKKAYRQRPDAKWFVFTECDGYINWTSLLSWLAGHDPATPYVGQLMIIGDVAFAYGGASFVVSNQAIKTVLDRYAAKTDYYEEWTGHHWAGDCVLGKALKDVEIDFTQAWPTFSGHSPYDMDYKDGVTGPDPYLWCYHAMTWHHMAPADILEFSAFEYQWNLKHSTLLRHADVFRHFILPKLGSQVEQWDNLSSDVVSADTLRACSDACQDKPSCAQYAFHYSTQTCKTSSIIKLGHAQDRKNDKTEVEQITSGWLMERVEAFMKEMDSSCHGDGWLVS